MLKKTIVWIGNSIFWGRIIFSLNNDCNGKKLGFYSDIFKSYIFFCREKNLIDINHSNFRF